MSSTRKLNAVIRNGCLALAAAAILLQPTAAQAAWTSSTQLSGQHDVVHEEILSTSSLWQQLSLPAQKVQQLNLVRVQFDDPHTDLRIAGSTQLMSGINTVPSYAAGLDKPGNSVVATVNGDFFFTSADYAGLPTGLYIVDGQLISYRPGQPAFAILEGNKPWIGRPQASMYAAVIDENGQEIARHAITAINKPRNVNDLILYDYHYGQSTRTNDWGTEVLITGINLPLTTQTDGTGLARLVKKQGEGNMELNRDTLVLSGHGVAADFLARHAQPGTSIRIHISFAEPLSKVESAIGGLPLLVENGKTSPLNLSDTLVKTPAPRTIAAIKDDELWLLVSDGRSGPGREGWTLSAAAQWLVEQGVDQAVNLDGGGSSTLAVRWRQWPVTVVNRPSDGWMRRVPNVIQVVSTAPLGEIKNLHLFAEKTWMLPGASTAIDLYGRDEYYNPIDINSVDWSSDDSLVLAADRQSVQVKRDVSPGTYRLTAGKNGYAAEVEIRVPARDEIARVEADFPAELQVGSSFSPNLRIFAEDGQEVAVHPSSLEWRISGSSIQLEEYRLVARSAGSSTIELLYDGQSLGRWTVRATTKGAPTPPVTEPPFRDMVGDWANEAVQRLVDAGAVQGYPDGTFRPNQQVTRAEFVKMLVTAVPKAFARETSPTSVVEFADFEQLPEWAKPSVKQAALSGIVTGFADGAFHANRPLSRQEAMTIIVRSLDSAYRQDIDPVLPLPFTDLDQFGDWAVPFAALAVGDDLISGYEDGTFRPRKSVSRAEAAVLVNRLLSRHESPAS